MSRHQQEHQANLDSSNQMLNPFMVSDEPSQGEDDKVLLRESLPAPSARYQIGGTPQRGHFYSPQYPSTYPKTAKCEYRFLAQPNERVRILFLDVSFSRQDQR